MTMGVFDFKAIRQKLEHNEQKADFEEKNPKPVETAMYGWPYAPAYTPYGEYISPFGSQPVTPTRHGRNKANG